MSESWKEFDPGEIHFRDRWQFELISDYSPSTHLDENVYTQEFYIFIPNALQVNHNTYSKQEFYRDQTSLIRLKTPVYTFAEMIQAGPNSPYAPLLACEKDPLTPDNMSSIEQEFKLLASIIRSAVRNQIRTIVKDLEELASESQCDHMNQQIQKFSETLTIIRKQFSQLFFIFLQKTEDRNFHRHLIYMDQFISFAINDYLTFLVEVIRKKMLIGLLASDHLLCTFVISENERASVKDFYQSTRLSQNSHDKERVHYRHGLLNKFVLDALSLRFNRASLDVKLANWIGSLSAGLAMFVYLLLFIWQGQVFLINSQPYVILTVLFYILKDRIKESLKALSYRHAFKWFSDYRTKIRSPNDNAIIGKIKESFTFIDSESLPKDIYQVRNQDFHDLLKTIRRPEQVIFYKKNVNLSRRVKKWRARLDSLTVIFRLDIHRFLSKASNPSQTHLTIEPITKEIIRKRLPKVYHINIIMKNTYLLDGKTTHTELKKFRLIVDKNGIKRIEKISTSISPL